MANVIVIGGGPAGMMAAITAAEYVKNVTIIEKNFYLILYLPFVSPVFLNIFFQLIYLQFNYWFLNTFPL